MAMPKLAEAALYGVSVSDGPRIFASFPISLGQGCEFVAMSRVLILSKLWEIRPISNIVIKIANVITR